MSGISSHKRIAGCVLGFLLLLAVSLWVTTSEEFADNGDGRTLVTRFQDAVAHRARFFADAFRTRKTGRGSKKDEAAKGKTSEITGPVLVRVRDDRGRPIRDVNVTYQPVGHGAKAVKGKTDTKGQSREKLPLGEYNVLLAHNKFSSAVRPGQTVVSPSKGFTLDVALEASVKVKGVVVDEEGKPVVGATVAGQRNWLQQFSETAGVFLDDAAYPTAVTDAKGAFLFEDVSIGLNTFSVVASGYASAEQQLEVPAGGLSKDLKFTMRRPARIVGRIMDENLMAVKGVKVRAISYRPFENTSPIRLPEKGYTVTSTEAGRFELSKLFTSGYYHLRFEHPAYAIAEQGYVSAGTDGLVITLQRGGEIGGRVAYIDRETTPAVVAVRATAVINSTTITRTVTSKPDGEFQFVKMPYGSYSLTIEDKTLAAEPRGRVTSAKDKPSRNNLIEVYQVGTVSGSVRDAYSFDAIAEAKVQAKAVYGYGRQRTRTFQATANAQGEFVFDKLPGGILEVTARADTYLPTSGNKEDYTVLLASGDTHTGHELFLSRGGVVQGQVVTRSGQGVADSEVQMYIASSSFSSVNVKDLAMTTDGSGTFEFRNIPIGQRLSLYASARKDGYAKAHSQLIELTPEQPEGTARIEMATGGAVSGQVTDVDGRPLYGVKITIESREFPRDPSPSDAYTFTDSQGQFLIERCTPGSAVLVAEHDDYVRQTRSVTISDERLLSNRNFKLKLSHGISGTVADFHGNPIANARVSAAPTGKSTGSGRGTTDKKGFFKLAGLGGEGVYRVEASFTLDTPDGKQSYTFIVPDVPVGTVNLPIDCDVNPSLSGRVRSRGKAVDEFTMTFRSKQDTRPAQQFRFNLTRKFTRAGGAFRILKIPRGLYTLKVTAPGYETWEHDEIIVGPGIRTTLPVIQLKPASQITGTVISNTTGKPVHGALIRVLDEGKESVKTVNRLELQAYSSADIIERLDSAFDDDLKYDPDPMMRLVARVRANVVTTKQTNVYGKFDLDDLAGGSYTLEIEHPMYRAKRLTNIAVRREDTEDLGDIPLEPGGIIRGQVMDNEGKGLNNVAVQVRGEMQGRNRARTDVAGNFQLRGIGYGEWPVSVLATLNGRKVYAWKNVTVRPDITSEVEYVLETTANATGQVILPDGAPKSGTVRFYVVDETGTIMDDVMYSANLSNGTYRLNNIPPGRYFGLAYGQGAKGRFAFWEWVDARRGQNTIHFRSVSASLAGTSLNASTGTSQGKSKIMLHMDVTGALAPSSVQDLLKINTTTGANGRYTFPYLAPGVYRVWTAGPTGALYPVDALPLGEGQHLSEYDFFVNE